MGKRIFSTIAIWFLLVLILALFERNGAIALLVLAAALTQWEFYQLLDRMDRHPRSRLGIALGVILVLAAPFLPRSSLPGELLALYLSLLVCSMAAIFSRRATRPVDALASTFLGILLIPFAFAHLLLLMQTFPNALEGLFLGVWTIAVAKFSDVGALLTGLAIGRHKMAPHISPAKTWEGAIGGVAFGTAIGALAVYLLADSFPQTLTPAYAAIAAVPLTIAAIFSDLLESALKREAGVKDSGATIPGIGGVFDLTDSLILTSPMAYYLFLPLAP